MSKRKKNKKMGAGKILLGVAAGLTTGLVLGLLFSPKKGSVLRRRISQVSMGYADDIKDKFGDFMDSIISRFEKETEEFTMAEDEETNNKR